MTEAYICEGVRTPVGRYGGVLAPVRPDDMAAHVIRTVTGRLPDVPWNRVDEVIMGCANQAGEDNRDVARMASLLADMSTEVPGTTINRLCGSGLDAIAMAARTIKTGEAHMILAGGVESMSRAPFVMGKAETAFSRQAEIYDTTIGWRFVNPKLKREHGIDSMPETGENVAEDFGITREEQDVFALRSQQRANHAINTGRMAKEIVPVQVPQRKGDPIVVERDEHPRETSLEKLAKLPTPFRENGTVTAGNASGVNDGAAMLFVASAEAVRKHGLTPKARVVGAATAGVPPRIMGMGPAPASEKLLDRLGLKIGDMDLVELNEAFASQSIAVLRRLGLSEDAEHVNPNGGAIALGHPLGMSGARIALSALTEMNERDARRALCTMCIGVGQGIAMVLERP